MRSDFNMDDYVREMREAMMQEAQNKIEYDSQKPTNSTDKCELCGRIGQDVHQLGSPLIYYACVDVLACELERAKGL